MMAKLSEFKVGDRVTHLLWDPQEWVQIVAFVADENIIGICDNGGGYTTSDGFDDPDGWKLYQEPKKKVWLWLDKEGYTSNKLSDQPIPKDTFYPGSREYSIKLPWSETGLP
jgi:hypothetical protein